MTPHAQSELGQGREGCHHVATRQTVTCTHAAELRHEPREWKRRVDTQIESVFGELAIVKNCIMQLYNVLLPGKFPPMQLQPPPAPHPRGQAPPPFAAAGSAPLILAGGDAHYARLHVTWNTRVNAGVTLVLVLCNVS